MENDYRNFFIDSSCYACFFNFIIWYYISKYNNRKINIYKLFIESIIIMFFTGFIIHSIFNVKSDLGYRLGFLEKPDGTGIVPYSNY